MPRRRANRRTDRISSLPDTILSHILSFLPTRHAISTSILSKRWKNLWRSVPALDFDGTNWDQNHISPFSFFTFNEFVYSVLLQRDPIQPIQRFSLVTSYRLSDRFHVSAWVQFVLQRKVEHLDLDVWPDPEMTLPVPILSCRTLVVLKLCGFVVKDVSSVSLPSLKFLQLDETTFHRTRDFLELLSGCPVLEDLIGNYIWWDEDEDIDSLTMGEFGNLILPKLVSVDIINSYILFLLKALCNVEFLSLEILKVKYCYNDIPTFHNLTHMDLIFTEYDWHLLVEILKHCPKLQILVLDEDETNGVGPMIKYDRTNWAEPEHVPECLSLHLRACTIRNFGGLEGELLLAKYILKNARVLQTMTICKTYRRITGKDKYKLKRIKELSLWPKSSSTCQISYK